MSEKRAELLLACVIIARSTSFVFNKLGLGTMTAFNLLAVRFLLAFVLLALLFWKRLRHISRRTVGRGALRAGLFCALSPAFATIFGAVLLREKITPLGLVGILLILGSLLLPHFIKGKKCHDEVQSSSV